MEQKGINILEKALKKYNGKDVEIHIFHSLYGEQKIKCCFDYIFDENRIGFKAGKNEIYILRSGIINFGVKDGIFFADDIMEIRIKL